MHKMIFTMECFSHPHIGYTLGKRWNGWATPFFEIDEALKLMEEFNQCSEDRMQYDEVYDQFTILHNDGEFEYWKGKNYNTNEGIKHLYGVGAYSWIWDDITKYDIYAMAQRVEDFLWESDTYEHRDQYDDREDLVEEIAKQMQDLKVCKQVFIVFYDFSLTGEELTEKLGKVLRV